MIISIKKCISHSLILIMAILFFTSCVKSEPFTDTRIAMGTGAAITVYEKKDQDYIQGAFDILYDVDRMISAKNPDSYISKINDSAGISPVKVPAEVIELVEYSLEIAEGTEGLFNPAIGALSELWAITSDNPHVPSEEELEAVLPLLDYRLVTVNEEDSTVYLEKEGMKLDLGAIGKGYAADIIRDYLNQNGVERAIINLGGNIYAHGRKSDKEKWRIAIRNPENTAMNLVIEEVEDKSVVTSGAYERFFEKDGVRYHHILSTETGYPTDSGLLSSSIITEKSILADALSTAVFAGGIEAAEKLSELYGVYIIVYTEDKEILRFCEP